MKAQHSLETYEQYIAAYCIASNKLHKFTSYEHCMHDVPALAYVCAGDQPIWLQAGKQSHKYYTVCVYIVTRQTQLRLLHLLVTIAVFYCYSCCTAVSRTELATAHTKLHRYAQTCMSNTTHVLTAMHAHLPSLLHKRTRSTTRTRLTHTTLTPIATLHTTKYLYIL
jgi:hypothetical protein